MSSMTKDEAIRSEALGYCSDFIADWDRFSSVISFMEDAIDVEAKEASSKDNMMDAFEVEQFVLNLYWLRKVMEESATNARKRLEAAGHHTSPRA